MVTNVTVHLFSDLSVHFKNRIKKQFLIANSGDSAKTFFAPQWTRAIEKLIIIIILLLFVIRIEADKIRRNGCDFSFSLSSFIHFLVLNIMFSQKHMLIYVRFPGRDICCCVCVCLATHKNERAMAHCSYFIRIKVALKYFCVFFLSLLLRFNLNLSRKYARKKSDDI